jgi:GT2 family glycosyltransferase
MLEQIGGFDTSFFAFVEDADVAWRARMAGWRCLYVPSALVHHHHSATARHGSPLKHYHVGRNRIRLLAKNADVSLLRRHGAAMVAYDIAYVLAHAITDRSLAPLRGRLAGLREWRQYRRAGAPGRRPVDLAPARGLRAGASRRAIYTSGDS